MHNLGMTSTPTHYRACVDIGGTKVAVSLARAGTGRELLVKRSEPTAKEGTNDALAVQIIRMIEAARAEVGDAVIEAVGVSSCGPFVLNRGMVELAAPNICGGMAGPERGLPNDWKTAVLEAPLRARYNKVRVDNDAIAALEAERRWGALQGLNHCAYITWSTGIGIGLCVDGHVLRGKNGNAGHAGHMFVSDHTDGLCGCGNVGDVEGLVAGNALPRRFTGQGYDDSATLFAAANAGEAGALGIVDDVCRVMGRMVYNLVITLDLQRVSVGGSVFWHNQALLLPRLRAQLQGKLPALTKGADIVPAGLGLALGDLAALALLT
jgi:glucokinase